MVLLVLVRLLGRYNVNFICTEYINYKCLNISILNTTSINLENNALITSNIQYNDI